MHNQTTAHGVYEPAANCSESLIQGLWFRVSGSGPLSVTQARAGAAERELAAVKQRAWALMEEKDRQLQAAKV